MLKTSTTQTQLTTTMNIITAPRFIELAADRVGPLTRRDNVDSARIWLQGKVNSYRADYAAGQDWAPIEQVKEAEAALEEITAKLAAL